MKKKVFVLFGVVLSILMVSSVLATTVTIRPDGQGYRKGWGNVGCGSGTSEWQCVDEDPADTDDYLKNIGTAKETFTFDDTGLSSETINSVTMYYYAKEHNSYKNSCFNAMTRSGSTDYVSGTQMCVNDTWQYKSYTYSTNPATGSAWTVAQVDALEAGMKATNPYGGGRVAQVYAVVDYTPANSCSDTDGGIVEWLLGTVSGWLSGSPYSNSDYCTDATTLVEYYCSGNYAYSTNISCIGNYTGCASGACY